MLQPGLLQSLFVILVYVMDNKLYLLIVCGAVVGLNTF